MGPGGALRLERTVRNEAMLKGADYSRWKSGTGDLQGIARVEGDKM